MAWQLVDVTASNFDLSSFVDATSLLVTQRAYAETSRLSALVIDETGTIADPLDHEWLLTDGAQKVFAGFVRQRNKADSGVSGQRRYVVECQDYTTLLADDYVPSGSGVRANGESDSARIAWLFSTFGTRGVVIGAAVQTLKASMPDQDFTGLNLHQCMTLIEKETGGSFYVDYDKALHNFSSEVNAASFGLSDNPNGTTTFGYEEFAEASDTVEFVNEVHVIGAPGVSTTRYLGGSPPAPGTRRATVIVDAEILDLAQAQTRGDALLATYGVTKKPSSLVTFKAGLRAGQYVQVTHAGWGISAVSYRIAGMSARPTTKDRIRYEVDFGNAAADLTSLMSGVSGAIDAVGGTAAGTAAGLASLVDLSVGGANLVPNSSFEDGTSWVVGAQWAIGFTPSGGQLPFHGLDTARAVLAAQTAGDLVTPKIEVARSAEYIVSFWHFIRSRTSGTFRAQVKQYSAANALLATTNVDFTAVDTEWTREIIRFAPAAALNPTKIAWQPTTARIEIVFNSAGAAATLTVDVDGVQLERGEAPTAYAPMPREILPGSISGTEIADDSVTTPKLVAEAVTSAKIAAGTITADKLAATLILGSLIRAGSSENRVELDSNGLRVYSAIGDLLVNMPTDASPVYINAEVVASTLQVIGNSTFRGISNVLAAGAALILGNKVEAPDQAPTLAAGWETLSVPYAEAVDYGSTSMRRFGLAYDAAGGAGGATKVFWTISSKDADLILIEMLATTRAVNRSVVVHTAGPGAGGGLWLEGVSVVRHSTWVYVLFRDLAAGVWRVKRYVASTLALANSYTPVMPGSVEGFGTQSPHLASDGTNLYIVDSPNSGNPTDNVKWNKYDAAMVKQGATVAGGDSLAASDRVRAAWAGTGDFGSPTMVVATSQLASTAIMDLAAPALSRGSQEAFPVPPGIGGLTYGDAFADGARFFSMPTEGAPAAFAITKHTTWTWTSASSKYWVAFTWYDSVATVHETTVSPRASITMGRRQRLVVTAPPIPIGTADDPDRIRVYTFPNATAPATTSLKLQTEVAASSAAVVTYNAGGAAPPTTNDFPVATPSEVRAAGGEFELRGDGTADLDGLLFAERTYSVTITGENDATFSTLEGRYIKIGRLVFVRITCTFSSAGSGGTVLGFSLPFPADVSNTGGGRPILPMTYEGMTGLGGFNNGIGAAIRLTGDGDGDFLTRLRTADNQNISRSNLTAAAFIQIAGWYETP